jgi:hypothetical protein
MRQLRNQKYEDFYRGRDPHAQPRQSAAPVLSKTNLVTCSTCFIRSRSGSAPPWVEELWAGADDSDNKASIISHAHGDNSRIIGNRRR